MATYRIVKIAAEGCSDRYIVDRKRWWGWDEQDAFFSRKKAVEYVMDCQERDAKYAAKETRTVEAIYHQ